jgi:hypothetical protein
MAGLSNAPESINASGNILQGQKLLSQAPDLARRYLRNITIPAAFITKSDGQVLKDLFKKSGGAEGEDVYIVMDWNDVLPRAQKVRPVCREGSNLGLQIAPCGSRNMPCCKASLF